MEDREKGEKEEEKPAVTKHKIFIICVFIESLPTLGLYNQQNSKSCLDFVALLISIVQIFPL